MAASRGIRSRACAWRGRLRLGGCATCGPEPARAAPGLPRPARGGARRRRAARGAHAARAACRQGTDWSARHPQPRPRPRRPCDPEWQPSAPRAPGRRARRLPHAAAPPVWRRISCWGAPAPCPRQTFAARRRRVSGAAQARCIGDSMLSCPCTLGAARAQPVPTRRPISRPRPMSPPPMGWPAGPGAGGHASAAGRAGDASGWASAARAPRARLGPGAPAAQRSNRKGGAPRPALAPRAARQPPTPRPQRTIYTGGATRPAPQSAGAAAPSYERRVGRSGGPPPAG
jgi:hypothetical protein